MASIKVLILLMWISFGLGSMVYAVFATEYGRILIFKEPLSNKALEGHLIGTEKVSDEGSCRLKCYLEPNCVSVNVGPLDEGTHICELNNDTDESPSHLALVERQLYTYHAVENACHCKPCPGKYALCQVGFTDKGYRCDCREGYRGERCNEGGGSLCGSCYKVFTADETWNNAEANCKSLGAQLVKIESAEENDYLTRTFLTASAVTYWIGLSDEGEEGKWIWTDGSPLGNYTNWGDSNPNNHNGNQNCGHIIKGSVSLKFTSQSGQQRLYSFSSYNEEWNDLECYVQLGYICEQFSP